MRNPRVIVFGGLLSDDGVRRAGRDGRAQRLVRSETVKIDTGGSEVNAARTSDGMFFTRGENAADASRIEERIAALLGWPVENGEGLQVLRYRPGAEYKPHYDYFDPAQPGTPSILKRGGQRVGSLVCYLNTPAKGGAHDVPRRAARGGAGQGQCGVLQLRPPAPDDAIAARRRPGDRGREVGRDQVDARGAVRLVESNGKLGRDSFRAWNMSGWECQPPGLWAR